MTTDVSLTFSCRLISPSWLRRATACAPKRACSQAWIRNACSGLGLSNRRNAKINHAQDNEIQVYNNKTRGYFHGSLLNMHLQISLNTCSLPNVHYKKMNMLRCSKGGEIRETKTCISHTAALNAATIYSIQKLSTRLMFRVFHPALSTYCCE